MIHGVAAIGLSSWDRFIVTDTYPGPGQYAIVREQLEQAGGTTGNTVAALARVGVEVRFVSAVGTDPEGDALIASLDAVGADSSWVYRQPQHPSDNGLIVVSGLPGQRDRTIYWVQGARPQMGDQLPIDEMLLHEWVHIDVDDPRLRNFLLALPAHRSPRTRLVGTLTYLVDQDAQIGWNHALRLDVAIGNVQELQTLTGTTSLDAAIAVAQAALPASACRVLYISRGPLGGIAIRPDRVVMCPALDIAVVDTTGAGDAFAAGCIWGLLEREDDPAVLRRAVALGSLVCRELGARAAQPDREEAESALAGALA